MVAVLVVAFGCARTAHALDSEGTERAAARQLGYSGVEAFEAKQYAVASEKLEKAYAVLRVPSLGLWSARALAKLGKLLEASERYREVTRLPVTGGDEEVQKQARVSAQSELDALQPRISNLVVRIKGAASGELSLMIDGTKVSSQLVGAPTPVNPGAHRVEGTAHGQTAVRDLTVGEGEQQEVLLELADVATSPVTKPPAPKPTEDEGTSQPSRSNLQRTSAYVLLAGGLAGLATGGVTGLMAVSRRASLDNNKGCADDHDCPRSLSNEVSTYNTLRNVSTVGFVAGGIFFAAGFTLLLTAPHAEQRTTLLVGPSFVSVRSAF